MGLGTENSDSEDCRGGIALENLCHLRSLAARQANIGLIANRWQMPLQRRYQTRLLLLGMETVQSRAGGKQTKGGVG